MQCALAMLSHPICQAFAIHATTHQATLCQVLPTARQPRRSAAPPLSPSVPQSLSPSVPQSFSFSVPQPLSRSALSLAPQPLSPSAPQR
eukprot:7384451-Prymnesium_polylepis.1